MELKTPLYECHVTRKGKMVPYAGYLLPVQFETGVIKEHMAVRTKAGLFDVSHMGEIILKGSDALKNLQKLITNDCSNMTIGGVKYSPMCNEDGKVIDDLLVYKVKEEEYLLVVNASNRHKDVSFIREHVVGDVMIKDISDEVAQIALQGPMSKNILEKLANNDEIPSKYYTFTRNVLVAGIPCLISKTGYTGEDGYEIYCKYNVGHMLWEELLIAGEEYGLIPCGLGARDTLRLEAGMPLYGHEMNEDITPIEASLSFAVKLNKEDFIGKDALIRQKTPTRNRVGLKIIGRGIAREESNVYKDDKRIGFTTSGTHLPYVNYAGAMALIDTEYSIEGTKLEVDVRGKRIEAIVVALPFYKKI